MERRTALVQLMAGLGSGVALANTTPSNSKETSTPTKNSLSTSKESTSQLNREAKPVATPAISSARSLKLQELAAVVTMSLQVANECKAFCLEQIALGEKALVECFQILQELIPICEVILSFTYLKSSHLAALCEICAKLCQRSKKICQPFKDTYAACAALIEASEICRKKCLAI